MPFRELVKQTEIRRKNLHAALYHNYVDEYGLPQPKHGIGVLDGLPELRYFLQSGTIELAGAAFACVMTDGLAWPASAGEVFTDDAEEAASLRRDRFAHMVEVIAERGLQGYLKLLRETEAADMEHERYPRMKTHDDATGVLLRFDA